MFKVFNFDGFRIGDKLAGCYQLQYYASTKGWKYLLFDTSAESLFSVKDYFPSISQYTIECKNPQELYTEIKEKGFEEISFGNLWISTPSIKKDTGFYPNMILPPYLRNIQHNFLDESNKRVLDYKIKIVNHCLTNAGYNTGRNHNREQFEKLINRIRLYIKENSIDAILIDVPIDYSWNINQIMALIELGDVYIGGDTGFTHAFSMFNPDKPIVAIYGSNKHDVKAFEHERISMNCSSSWNSDPLASNNYTKFVMENNLFDADAVYNKIIEHINNLNK